MRRRALRMIRRAGLIAPTLMAVAAHAQSPAPAAKDGRGVETAPAAARLAPTPGDVAASDPVAAAFSLFSGRERGPAIGEEAPRGEPVAPPAATVAEIEPGVVVAERPMAASEPAVPATADGATTPVVPEGAAAAPQGAELAYGPSGEGTTAPVDRLFGPPGTGGASTAGMASTGGAITAALPRPYDVPLPRRRPAVVGAAPTEVVTAGEMRLASLEPPPAEEPARAAAPIAAETAVFGEPKKIPDAAKPYMALIRREAAANKVPLWLAVGVGWVESKYQPSLRGTHGVVGLMQVMPSTARYQGYKGPSERLLDPETNIIWGMKELGWDWAKSGGNPCLAIAKYKGGIATKRISPAAADYCKRAKAATGMG